MSRASLFVNLSTFLLMIILVLKVFSQTDYLYKTCMTLYYCSGSRLNAKLCVSSFIHVLFCSYWSIRSSKFYNLHSVLSSHFLSLCVAVVCIGHMELDSHGYTDGLSGPGGTAVGRWRAENGALWHGQVLHPWHLHHSAAVGAGHLGMADLQMLHTDTLHIHPWRYLWVD